MLLRSLKSAQKPYNARFSPPFYSYINKSFTRHHSTYVPLEKSSSNNTSSKLDHYIDKQGFKKYSFVKYGDNTYYKPCLCFDIETTGLDFNRDTILEVSLLITDRNLDVIPHGRYDAVAKIDANTLLLLDQWAEKVHTDSGLLNECLSQRAKSIESIDTDLYNLTKRFLNENEKGILLGNSVHFDRYFVQEHLPKFSSLLSHKVIDVTSLLELKSRLKPDLHVVFKKSNHRAGADVSNSLRIARNFKYNVFDGAEAEKS